jgi:predicted transcriptional regulator
VIYCTNPVKKVVAEVKVEEILYLPKEELWELTNKVGGISKPDFLKYFSKTKKGYAYRLGKILRYPKPTTLNDFKVESASQSFIYLKID